MDFPRFGLGVFVEDFDDHVRDLIHGKAGLHRAEVMRPVSRAGDGKWVAIFGADVDVIDHAILLGRIRKPDAPAFPCDDAVIGHWHRSVPS